VMGRWYSPTASAPTQQGTHTYIYIYVLIYKINEYGSGSARELVTSTRVASETNLKLKRLPTIWNVLPAAWKSACLKLKTMSRQIEKRAQTDIHGYLSIINDQ